MSTPAESPVKIFVIRNQDDRYLTKKHLWRSGVMTGELYRAKEHDVALNELIEVNAKDVLARLEIVACEIDKQKQPVVEVLADDPSEGLDDSEGDVVAVTEEPAQPPHLELVKKDSAAESLSPAQ